LNRNQSGTLNKHDGLIEAFRRHSVVCLLACAGFSVYMGLPMILASLAQWRGYSDQQLGWIASALMLGLFLGSLLTSWLIPRCGFLVRAASCCTVGFLANVCAAVVTDFYVFLSLVLVGSLAGGVCYSSAVAKISRDENTVSDFSLLMGILILVGSLEIALLPLISRVFEDKGVLFVIALAYLVPLALLRRLQLAETSSVRSAPNETLLATGISSVGIVSVLCLVAIVAYFMAASSLWAYAERLGARASLSTEIIGATLSLSNFATLLACACALYLSNRLGQYRLLAGTMLLTQLVFSVWIFYLERLTYVAGIILFFQAWALAGIYQFWTLSEVDASGRFVALVPGAQGVGLAAGPFVTALFIDNSAQYKDMLVLNSVFLVAAILIYAVIPAVMSIDRRKTGL
jgi:MFS family permease